MTEPSASESLLRRILAEARADEHIVGVVDYGSSSEGRADEWSDLDLTLFIRDADFEAFAREWKPWAAQFGELLLAYVGGVGHPWTVYDTAPLPLRVDFEFQRESEIARLHDWPNSPASVAAMALYDGSGGWLCEEVGRLVGKSLCPVDVPATFEQVAGDFWYYLLQAYCKLQRGEAWHARQRFHVEVMRNLFNLLRLEAGELEHWQGTTPSFQAEGWLSPEHLVQLDACVPAPGPDGLHTALAAVARVGSEVCAAIAAKYGLPWAETLAARIVTVFAK